MREFKLEYFNLYTTLKDIVLNIWVMFLAAVIGFLGVRAYFDFTYTPQYTCNSIIAINSLNGGMYSYSSLAKTIDAASTFQEMFQSTYFKERLESMTDLEMDGNIYATQVNSTNLITISYTCGDPYNAYRILNEVITNYNEISNYYDDSMIINVISPPSMPLYPSNARGYGRRDYLGGIGAALVVLLLIIFISFMRDTVKNPSDVESMLNTRLIGAVYHENKRLRLKGHIRAGLERKSLLVTDILISAAFTDAYRRIVLKLDYFITAKNKKTFMVTSFDENEGKSTVSVNIAITAAQMGKKVLLVDGDLRKPSAFRFFGGKIDDELYGLGELLAGEKTIQEVLRQDEASGLYLIAGNKRRSDSSELIMSGRYESFIRSVSGQFDFVLVDTSPVSMVADAEMISAMTDGTLLVVTQDLSPVPQINDMIYSLTQAGGDVVGCVLNDIHVPNPKIFGQTYTKEPEEVTADAG